MFSFGNYHWLRRIVKVNKQQRQTKAKYKGPNKKKGFIENNYRVSIQSEGSPSCLQSANRFDILIALSIPINIVTLEM
jgi:hypothetical protein